MALKKIGLLGGSFDPVHLAHVALAKAALEHLALDTVQLIPAADPWQRKPLGASSTDRLNMLRLAIQGLAGLDINTAELERGGKTYTIDTLEALPRNAQYFWVLGADQLANFCSWHRWEDILVYVHLVVAQRQGSQNITPPALGYVLDALKKPLIHLPFEPVGISATAIRNALQTGQPATAYLNPDVQQYIKQHHLYQH